MLRVHRLENNRGAAMVEMALIAILVFLLLGAIFDFVVGFRQYSLMTHSLMDVSRRTAATRGNCAQFQQAPQAARDRWRTDFENELRRYGVQFPANGTFTATPIDNKWGLALTAEMPFSCIACKLIKKNIPVKTKTSVRFEECS